MKKFLHHFQNVLTFGNVLVVIGAALLHTIPLCNYQEAEKLTEAAPSELLTITPELPQPAEDITDQWKFNSDLVIWAVNPGYTVDGTRDVGEFIELHRTTDTSISLAGYALRYTNSSGTTTSLIDFSEGSSMAGESLLLRLAKTSTPNQADATYMTTLAMSGGKVELVFNNEVVDSVCWSGKGDCYAAFKSSRPTTLLRDAENGIFTHVTDYQPNFDSSHPSLILPEIPDDTSDYTDSSAAAKCGRIEFSEILSYYADNKSEQFIELFNPTDQDINLVGCSLRYKNKTYPLSGVITANRYYTYRPDQSTPSFSLTKNPNTSNLIELLGSNTPVDALVYNHGQKKSTSYAKFYDQNGEEIWQSTYSPTPGEPNILQEFRSCPEGKVINVATGNCVKASSFKTVTTDCPEGKYRNPLTGRCKKIESEDGGPKPCAEGYERNPETNRCRKIKKSNSGADYPLVPETYSDNSTFIALGVVILLVSAGSIYIVLQFRHEIMRLCRKLRQSFNRIRQHLLTRCRSLHRHKKP